MTRNASLAQLDGPLGVACKIMSTTSVPDVGRT